MDQAVAQNQDLTDRLVSALRQDEFILYGQPIVPLAIKPDWPVPQNSINLSAATLSDRNFAAIIRECHALGIKTIAEHVESERTLAHLRGLGVNFGQGFGIQAPQPLAWAAGMRRRGA